MRYLYIAILLAISVLLIANNQLEVVWQQHGEQANDSFGKNVVSLDFNGDNIDDLAVNAYRYYIDEEHTNQKGKLYVYYGSEDGLPESPDFIASTLVDTTKTYIDNWWLPQNLGDMNGDGFDDIGYRYSYGMYDGEYSFHHYCRILLGSSVNDTIPDYEYEVNSSSAEIHPLGDINGDGYDDAGVTEEDHNYLTYSIIYGGSFEKVVFIDSIYTRMSTNRGFRGLGDVNNDGYDDFSFCYEGENVHNPDETFTYNYFFRFFWGGAVQDTIPDALLHYQRHTYSYSLLYELMPAGDWDNDGYDDFAFKSYDLNEDFEAVGTRLWRGGETIDWDRYTYIETSNFFMPAIGDINGDQKNDYIDTNPSEYGGCLYFYLGNQNGTEDYYDFDGHYGYGGGYAVGDFDNDGFDDIAVGAYGESTTYPSNYGDVYVYAGHAGLVEQDPEPVDDETVPPADITFNAYPNPFNPEVSFEIKTDTEYHDLTIEIYNIRGQKVDSVPIPLIRGNKRGFPSSMTWNAGDFASGVYFCKLNAGDRTLQTQKVTLMK